MIKNKMKLSVVGAMLLTTCSFAGTVTAPNNMNIDVSGDVELKVVNEKTGSENISKRTAEVNLGLESELKNGIKIITNFKVFDGSQAQGTAGADGTDDGFKVTEAYTNIPIMNNKGKIIAGLAENKTYGTDAFDDGGETWKIGVNAPIAKGVKLTLVSKVENEEESDSNKGDSGMTALRVDAKVGEFMIGAKYGMGYMNKGDGVTGDSDTTEKDVKLLNAYLTGTIEDFEVGIEVISKDVELVGAPSASQPQKGLGYYLSIGKEFGDLSAGISYTNVSKGMTGGEDFALGLILDGNIDSSGSKDTSVIAIPLEYKINENLTANAVLMSVDMQGNKGSEIDLGAAYSFDDSTELSLTAGKYSIDNTDDQTNIELALAIEF